MATSNESERMPRIRNGTLRRTNLILLAFMFWGVPMVQAQVSLEDLQKRKTIAEAEKAAIEAETARDEARKKQSESVAPLDPVKKAKMEPAIRIERTTCGLRISDNPTSDNLTPQETTNQDASDMGQDGAGLSCPGSSVVADMDNLELEQE
jgi:hypothetical protein